jgi:hypothetical protein
MEQNKPDQWSLVNEGYERITRLDYYGNEYQAWVKPKKDLGKAWSSFRSQFLNQPTKDIKGRSNIYDPPMDIIDYNNQTR